MPSAVSGLTNDDAASTAAATPHHRAGNRSLAGDEQENLDPAAPIRDGSERIGDGGDAIAPRIDGENLVMADGAVLPMTIWRPDGTPKAVILALHGFNDYGTFIKAAGAFFAKQGVATGQERVRSAISAD